MVCNRREHSIRRTGLHFGGLMRSRRNTGVPSVIARIVSFLLNINIFIPLARFASRAMLQKDKRWGYPYAVKAQARQGEEQEEYARKAEELGGYGCQRELRGRGARAGARARGCR